MLKINQVSRTFGGITALANCSLTITAEQITAIVGPNGAGKTTLLDIISGFIKPNSGQVTLSTSRGNHQLTSLRPDQIANLGINRTWQQVRLFRYLTIADHLRLSVSNSDTKVLQQVLGTTSSPGDAILAKHLAPFGIDRPLDTIVSDLSYGQRKLLQLAMAALRPHYLLLLDEPVAGVNQVIQEKIEQLLLDFKAQGETVVVIEHDMEFVAKLADQVIVMDEGRVLTAGPPRQALQDQRVLDAYLGA